MWFLTICLLAAVIGFILNVPLVTAGTITVCALVALVMPRKPARSGDSGEYNCIDPIVYDETAKVARGTAHIVYAEGIEGAEDTRDTE